MDAAAPPLGTFAVWVPAVGVAVSALAVSVPALAVLVGEAPAVAPGFPGAPAAGAASPWKILDMMLPKILMVLSVGLANVKAGSIKQLGRVHGALVA